MNKHKYSTAALILITVLVATAGVIGLDSSDLDDLCDTNDRFIYRTGGNWECKAEEWLDSDGDTATGNYNFDSNTFVIDAANNRVGIGTASPAYPLEVNKNVSGISIYSQANISATGYNTRTSVFDSSKNAFDYIHDAEDYKTNGEIDHKKFYGYAGTVESTDYSRPVVIQELDENCTETYDEILNETIKTCSPYYYETTTYPYTKTEEQVSITAEIDLLRQAVYELNEKVKILEAKCK
jgi:hypothetical protein